MGLSSSVVLMFKFMFLGSIFSSDYVYMLVAVLPSGCCLSKMEGKIREDYALGEMGNG